jgi:recombination protein RecR
MTELPLPVQALVLALKSLPGIGPRSAERLALHVIQMEHRSGCAVLAEALIAARARRWCRANGAAALTESQPCRHLRG